MQIDVELALVDASADELNLGVQARTLEIYAGLGIAEHAIEIGRRTSAANLWVQGKRAARVPLGDIGRDLKPLSLFADPRAG